MTVGTPVLIGSGSASGLTTQVVTLSAGASAGSAVSVIVHGPGETISSITDTQGNAYTSRVTQITSSGATNLANWSANNIAALSITDTITITWSSTGAHEVAVVTVSNVANPANDKATTTRSNAATTLTVTSGVLTQADEVSIGAMGTNATGGSFTEGSGFTNLVQLTGLNVGYKIVAATSSISYAPSYSVSGQIVVQETTFMGFSANLSLALTGGSITSTAGSLVANSNLALTGNSIISGLGNVTFNNGNLTIALTGQSLISASGLLNSVSSLALAGSLVTNLTTQSQSFSTWSGFGLLGSTLNATIAPDGTTTATLFIPSAVNSVHGFDYAVTKGSGSFNFSIYLKTAGYTRAALRVYDGSTYQIYNCLDVTTGVIVSQVAGTIFSEYVGNGWFRVSCSGTSASGNMGATSGWCIDILDSTHTTQQAFLADGVSGIYAWGAQITSGLPLYPYIPTTTANVSANVGNAIQSYAGIASPGLTASLAGGVATSTVGSLALTRAQALSGGSVTSTAGSLAVTFAKALAGLQTAAIQGTLKAVSVIGLLGSGLTSLAGLISRLNPFFPSAERTYLVNDENRIYIINDETRIYTIDDENRTYIVDSENRNNTI